MSARGAADARVLSEHAQLHTHTNTQSPPTSWVPLSKHHAPDMKPLFTVYRYT
jgi:hypothetical protein